MPQTLGITVTNKGTIHHVLGLARSATKAGINTRIFLTGDGVNLIQESAFAELIKLASIGICEVSFIARGFGGKEIIGLTDKDFVTQGYNAEMVEQCYRYIIL